MKVAVCRPFHGPPCRPNERAIWELRRAHPDWFVLELGGPNLHLIRDMLAETALSLGVDVVLWIDGDMGFSVAAAVGIVARAVELQGIVGGLYLAKSMGGAVQAEFLPGQPAVECFTPASPTISVRGIGFGLAAHPSDVLKTVASHCSLEYQRINETKIRPFFDVDPTSSTTTTDDFMFCRRAIHSGVCVYADTRWELEHFGEFGFKLVHRMMMPNARVFIGPA
jgi:hypothetical protein